ncbi:MAG: aromatic amino acid hydroxylase [Bacteroidota bacterium]
MQLNEVTEKLPPHLLQFVVDQPYDKYTPVDQAVWRYVMRQNYHHLRKVAHESYVQGLNMTGVDIEQIPTMYGMNRILKDIGWAAVAVDGFIPPGAFMEFTMYNVLVIAADIRTLEHIEYTPAPDVIHESAGHAPILAVPEFAAYLKDIGEAGSKAFSSHEDFALYEAIRHLSIIKEDPDTPAPDIEIAEKEIEKIQSNMGPPSEMALIRNLHWWTVEYGLIGTVENHKIYGAGLLSSIGESMSCLGSTVKKIPYTLDAMNCNYDITKPQPQLFVTPNFAHLTTVLNEFKKSMAWITGGLAGVNKAIASKSTGTVVFSNGLQISGTFTEVITDGKDPVYIKTTGPSALSVNNVQMENFGKEKFPNGLIVRIGKGIEVDNTIIYELKKDDRIISVFAGPADPEAFEPNVNVPREKMHKITYDDKDLELHELYRSVRNARSNRSLVATLPATWKKVVQEFPSDWLLPMEILEVLQKNSVDEALQSQIWNYLEAKASSEPSLKKLIDNGLSLLRNSFTTA